MGGFQKPDQKKHMLEELTCTEFHMIETQLLDIRDPTVPGK